MNGPKTLRLPALLLLLLASLTGGCAKYEFQIVEPPSLSRRIGYQDFERVEIPPISYHFRAYENHLILRAENLTSDPIQLVGEQSTIVSPDGQSHPLRSESIAPNSFIKLILPPIRPRLERSGPSFGIGVGYSTGRATPLDRNPIDTFEDNDPKYLYVVQDESLYWDWEGETDIRMNLVFRRGDKQFSQGFVIHRVKVK